jgi:hypothetical protein
MEFYSDMRKDEIFLFARKWVELENINFLNRFRKPKAVHFL